MIKEKKGVVAPHKNIKLGLNDNNTKPSEYLNVLGNTNFKEVSEISHPNDGFFSSIDYSRKFLYSSLGIPITKTTIFKSGDKEVTCIPSLSPTLEGLQ